MQLREFADRILFCESLEMKLQPAEKPLTDDEPGPPVRVSKPARPPALRFAHRPRGAKMPHPDSFYQPILRATAHHILANHELQALEVMAFTLRAFPKAPKEFRIGLVDVMHDEQRHTRMHLRRLEALGLEFGQRRVNGYVWKKALDFESPLDYCACLALTFEGGNLDHSLEFAGYFEEAGDEQSAEVMRVIHRDEIEHVAFGLHWLRRLKPSEQSDWEAYTAHLHWPMAPHHAKGSVFQRESRRRCGMTDEFIAHLEQATATQAPIDSRG